MLKVGRSFKITELKIACYLDMLCSHIHYYLNVNVA